MVDADLTVEFPPDLPITERVDEIREVIANNQVVIIAGETGSGKSTQLPKICLTLAREGLIGHTQPRRIAARSVAERVAEELGTDLGDTVGYTVRFTDQVSKHTRVKVMTDGILLAETQRDPLLRKYETLIIDEAHERSLNIDFLLGYLKQLLPKRPDLRLIITSATIDTERFSQHFDDAPTIEVSGRTYPVEIRYRPLTGPEVEEERSLNDGICAAVQELVRQGPGDILVFCSGERDIRDGADALNELALADTEILPLFARMSSAEQHRIFRSHSGRRIVLATNVAETSLTVPGIRSVIDPGLARISRYNLRTKVQRLPIEEISQASANQRAGRCGRVAAGICIRLYSEDDFEARPEFTEPEIQRTNLSSVILRMASLGLGDVAAFPFVEPPSERNINDGILLLEELDAVDPDAAGTDQWLTGTGRRLARIPVDPRLGRMLLEAAETASLRELLIITAGLSIIDPRERPPDERDAARASHARFDDPRSDFLSLLHLWEYLGEQRRELSGNQFRRMCRREFINFNRVREWQDLHSQLRRITKDLGIRPNTKPGDPNDIHQALLAGLLSQVGVLRPKKKDARGREYTGARGAVFAIARGSSLDGSSPAWVMAGEMVETNRLWARRVAPVDPKWIEQVAPHLVHHRFYDPIWDAERGAASVFEDVTLYGLPVVTGRRANLARVDRDLARKLFIRHGLLDGEGFETNERDRLTFRSHNQWVLDEVTELAVRARRPELVPEPESIVSLYDQHLGPGVADRRSFRRWWKKVSTGGPNVGPSRLELAIDDVLSPEERRRIEADYPPRWLTSEEAGSFRLLYEHDPGSASDGVTIEVPVAVLGSIDPARYQWNVPGHRLALVTAALRSLPRAMRKPLVPIPETAATVLAEADLTTAPSVAIAAVLRTRFGFAVEPGDFDWSEIPDYLVPTWLLLDSAANPFLESKNLDALRLAMDAEVREVVDQGWHELEQTGLRLWSFGDLPRTTTTSGLGHDVTVFPSLIDRGEHVDVVLAANAAEQAEQHWDGIIRLLRFAMPSPVKNLDRRLTNEAKLAMAASSHQGRAVWYDDTIAAVLDELLIRHGGIVFEQDEFQRLCRAVRDDFLTELSEVAGSVSHIAERLQQIDLQHPETQSASAAAAVDVSAHLERLVYPGFIRGVGAARLGDVARYLDAINHRLSRLRQDVAKDRTAMLLARSLEAELQQATARQPATAQRTVRQVEEIEEVTWLLEEFRVSLYAQHLRGTVSVSEKRIRRLLRQLID